MAESKNPESWVDRAIGDPAKPNAVRCLAGYRGRSTEPKKFRLYGDRHLSTWSEIAEADVVHTASSKDDLGLEITWVWVKLTPAATSGQEFLTGTIATAVGCTAPRTQFCPSPQTLTCPIPQTPFCPQPETPLCPIPRTLYCPPQTTLCPAPITRTCPSLACPNPPVTQSVACQTVLCPTGAAICSTQACPTFYCVPPIEPLATQVEFAPSVFCEAAAFLTSGAACRTQWNCITHPNVCRTVRCETVTGFCPTPGGF